MTKIGIISDTHVGKNMDGILEKVSNHFGGVDLILIDSNASVAILDIAKQEKLISNVKLNLIEL